MRVNTFHRSVKSRNTLMLPDPRPRSLNPTPQTPDAKTCH
jgi:hypothetical protein